MDTAARKREGRRCRKKSQSEIGRPKANGDDARRALASERRENPSITTTLHITLRPPDQPLELPEQVSALGGRCCRGGGGRSTSTSIIGRRRSSSSSGRLLGGAPACCCCCSSHGRRRRLAVPVDNATARLLLVLLLLVPERRLPARVQLALRLGRVKRFRGLGRGRRGRRGSGGGRALARRRRRRRRTSSRRARGRRRGRRRGRVPAPAGGSVGGRHMALSWVRGGARAVGAGRASLFLSRGWGSTKGGRGSEIWWVVAWWAWCDVMCVFVCFVCVCLRARAPGESERDRRRGRAPPPPSSACPQSRSRAPKRPLSLATHAYYSSHHHPPTPEQHSDPEQARKRAPLARCTSAL